MSENTVHVRVVALGGLAACSVCSRLVAWKRSLDELDGLDEIPCPVCGGSLVIEDGSVVPEIEIFNEEVR